MKKIHKYIVPVIDTATVIKLKADYTILSIQNQGGNITLWVSESDSSELHNIEVSFFVIGTGGSLIENTEYLGTVQVNQYVWHVFIRQ